MRRLGLRSTAGIVFAHGTTPLMVASRRGAARVVQWIAQSDGRAHSDKDGQGNTALHYAAAGGSVACVGVLVEAGAQISARNSDGATALHFAAYHGQQLMIGRLQAGVLNARDGACKTALMLAAFRGRTQAVLALLGHGALVNVQDGRGWTALMYAAFAGRIAICRELLDVTNRALADRATGKCAADLARDAGYYEVADMLLDRRTELRTPSLPDGVRMPNLRLAFRDTPPPPLPPPPPPLPPPPPPGPNTQRGTVRTQRKMRIRPQPAGPPDFDDKAPQPLQRKVNRVGRGNVAAGQRAGSAHAAIEIAPTAIAVPDEQTHGGSDAGEPIRSDGMSDRIRDAVSRTSLSCATSMQGRSAAGTVRRRRLLEAASPRRHSHSSAWVQPCWRGFALLVTLWIPSCVLRRVLGKETKGMRQAWREKLALCFVIALVTAVAAFVSFGLSLLLCHPADPITLDGLRTHHGANATVRLVTVRGRIYDVSRADDARALGLGPGDFGRDASGLFAPLPEEAAACRRWLPGASAHSCISVYGPNPRCVASEEAWAVLRRRRTTAWVTYQWADVLRRRGARDMLFVHNEFVYSLKPLLGASAAAGESDSDGLRQVLGGLVGTDATLAVAASAALQAQVPCWNAQLRIGRIEGSTVGCVLTSGITIAVTVVLNTMILVKLVCAVIFDWAFSLQLRKITKHFARTATRVPLVLVTVTCYDESESTLRATLDSIALANYARSRKLLLVVADGAHPAPLGCSAPEILRAMVVPADAPSAPLPYTAAGEGPSAFNAAEVTPGTYTSTSGIVVPCILVIKVGTARERASRTPKAGNRGKRDSQLIAMQWLRSALVNDRLTPLEFALCRAASVLAQAEPTDLEYLLMVDADTTIAIECIPRLVAAMERDPAIMGLCGETRVANKRDSWVTRIQVYEYYISHHLSKAFESLWGGVTCLPGCCSMYRVFARKGGPTALVPLLVAPEVVAAYSSNDTQTLHQKNLLLLGEDRYLTTVLLRAFPRRKLLYVPRAVCRTMVPTSLAVLVSQRRRWINSTIHNLLELVLVRDLCGAFCCSMRFLVLMDLLGNAVLPASVIFCYYLVVAACLGRPVALPLLLVALAFALQVAMILATTRRVSYVYWMAIYIAALPLWNLVMPLYAFWRFDDFSWGRTRPAGAGGLAADPAAFITTDERQALEPIPLMRWREWMQHGPPSPRPPAVLSRTTSTTKAAPVD